MSESIQQSLQRFHISPDDMASSSVSSSSSPPIPILQRSIEAKSHSLKLKQVSPICVLVVGMAGSGKTTLMAALQRSLSTPNNSSEDVQKKEEQASSDATTITANDTNTIDETGNTTENDSNNMKKAPIGYCLNLDPATKLVPFGASIDIRDTIDYKVSYKALWINLCKVISLLLTCVV